MQQKITVNKNLFLEVSPDDLGNIINALQERPYKQVAGTLQSIERQVFAQMMPAKEPGKEEVNEPNGQL